MALKPVTATFAQAAAMPTAYLTGLQGLRDKGGLKAGDKVLVIGASGGCGLAGISLAKHLGAKEIVAVCSGKNKAVVRERGATKVVDYTTEDLGNASDLPKNSFDLVYDTASGSGAGEDYMPLSERYDGRSSS